MLNRIPTFNLKAMNAGDDVYVDEQGRHVIFRTINGQVVPIRTDSNGYASWLKKQGVEVDPSDQKTLDQLDRQLEIFDMARERGGPELQQKYQQAFEKDLKKRQKLVRDYYNQALQNQAESQGTTAENLQKEKEQRYQQHKDKEVSRTSLKDRGWPSYIKSYTKQIIDAYNATPDDKTFYLIHAFDTILMKGLSLAEQGVPLSNIDVADLVSSELQDPKTFERLFSTRYTEIAEQENFDPNSFLSNFYPSMESLNKIFSEDGEAAKDLTSAFNAVYNRALQDFYPEEEDKFTDLPAGFSDALGLEEIPEELPAAFSSKEAQALMGVYNKKSAISPLKSAHEVTLHAMSRLFESIPQSEKVGAAVSLADDQAGLHALHKDGYRAAYKEKNIFGMDINNDDAVETILREAAKAQSGTTTDKINAMKKIAHALGRIDGVALARQDDRGFKSHISRWAQSSIRAGRSKADGPGLIDAVLDPDSRASNILPNSVLRIPDTGDVKPQQPDLEDVPQKETSERRENEVHPGFFASEGRIVSEDGYGIEITGKRWDVYSPDNELVGSVTVTSSEGTENIERVKQKAFGEVKEVISGHKANEKDIQEAQEENERVFTNPAFSFSGELSEDEQSVLDSIDLNEYNVSEVAPGLIYRVSKDDKQLDVVYSQDNNLYFVERSDAGLEMNPVSQDYFNSFFGPEENEAERTTAEQTEDFFEGVAGGVSAGARDATRRRLEEEGSLPLTSDASRQIALEDPNYNVVDDEIVGVRTEDGIWHGSAPEENSAEEETSDEPEEPKEIPQERSPEGTEQNNQRLGNVMSWGISQEDFDTLMDNFDYEEEGIFWSYDEESGIYDVSMPRQIREEFSGLINRSINFLPSLKL